MKVNVKKRLIHTVFAVVLFSVLKMAYEIGDLPNFGHGKAYVNYSWDSKKTYKVLKVFPQEHLSRSVFWGPVLVLIDKKTNSILSITKPPSNWVGEVPIYWWRLPDDKNTLKAFSFDQNSDKYDVDLPPSLWRQLHAWLVVKTQGIQLENMTMVYDDEGKFW